MLDFDLPFIRDATLRESLERDLKDIRLNWDNERWKPVIIGSGSIMEALLLDTLLLKGLITTTKSKPLDDCMLGDLIDEAERQKLLNNDHKNTANVIKNFRNLIHPGRELRLKITPNESTAHVAVGLLNSIVDEVRRALSDPRRLNAQELMAKAHRTPYGHELLETLLIPMWEPDRLTLAKDLIPPAFLEGQPESNTRAGGPFTARMLTGDEVQELHLKTTRQTAYIRLYFCAFDSLQDSNKQICLSALADRVRRISELHVHILISNLFKPEHLPFAHDGDTGILTSASASVFANGSKSGYWLGCQNLLPYLKDQDIRNIVVAACRGAFDMSAHNGSSAAKDFLRHIYRSGNSEMKKYLLRIAQTEDILQIEIYKRKNVGACPISTTDSLTDYISIP